LSPFLDVACHFSTEKLCINQPVGPALKVEITQSCVFDFVTKLDPSHFHAASSARLANRIGHLLKLSVVVRSFLNKILTKSQVLKLIKVMLYFSAQNQ